MALIDKDTKAYIEGYNYDIFISYSHIDNEKPSEQTVGWITEFYKNLSVAIWQSIGTRDVKIWWDERLDGGSFFDDVIEDAVRKSAILLCLNSPGYQKSPYCKKELELFYKTATDEPIGLKVGKHSRIINVLLNNIPYKNWPKELSGTSGFHFYDAINNESRGHRLDTKSSQFNLRLQDLTDVLGELIEEFPKGGVVHDEKKFTIFFADVADSLRAVRKRMITEVAKEDYKLIFEVPPPFEVEEHEESVKEQIEAADMTVHLLDQYPGREIEGEETLWYPKKQAELCLLSDKPQVIWIPEEVDINVIEEDQYKAFMKELKQSSKKNIEYIIGTKSELPKHITDLAKQLKQAGTELVTNGKVPVLLDTHYNDQLYALEMSKSLLENNIQPFINPQSDNPLENITIFKERIRQVKSLIFFYGKVGRDWVMERMNEARKEIVIQDYPIEEFYVYLLPPHKDPEDKSLKQRFIKVNVLNNSDMSQLDTITLHQLLENIKAYHE